MKKEIKKEEKKEVLNKEITNEMKNSYMEYAMSVIVSRAISDLRDGLKPVQRRIIYTMYEEGLTSQSKFRKCATVVGSCLGKYHPHGDTPVYEALVRMAQDFTLRYPLVQGQGNFGSIDGDPAASMRYTECRLSKFGEIMLQDIEKETVDFVPNYDGTRKEPVVLPSPLPQVLLNGSLGIAVGMASSIPPHNLKEIVDCLLLLLEKKDATLDDLFRFFHGPDFPTGGEIFNLSEIKRAYSQGFGPILIRAKAQIVKEKQEKEKIVITEIPYQVQKATLLEEMAKLVLEKKVKGIKDIRDESDKEGLRIVIDLQKEANAQQVLKYLFNHTNLSKKFYLNLLVLVDGIQPKVLSLLDVLNYFLDHRREIVRRRSQYLLEKAKERAHILEGLLKCLLNIDLAIKIIRRSKDRQEAKKALMSSFKITEIQAEAILEIKLALLVRMEREKIQIELKGEKEKIKKYSTILAKKENIDQEIKKELQELKEKFQDERRTKLSFEKIEEKVSEEELIALEPTIVFLTQNKGVKRLSPETLKLQKKGSKGGLLSREEPFERFIFTDTHSQILFFTKDGKVFKLPVYEIEEGKKTNKAKPLSLYLGQDIKEDFCAILSLRKREEDSHLVLVTKMGQIKRVKISDFEKIKKTGTTAMIVKNNDVLQDVEKLKESDEILVFTQNGQAIHFSVKEIKEMSKKSGGVKGMGLKKDDFVVGIEKINSQRDKILLVSEKGLGKVLSLKEVKKQKRGGKGIRIMKINQKSGFLVFGKTFFEEENLLLASQNGHFLRINLKTIPKMSRNSQGVKLIKIEENDKINWAEIF